MRYEEVANLRDHPAWAVLRSPHAPLVLSFLSRVFVDRNAADLPATQLVEELDDELYALNQRLGEATFPRPAGAYLDEWASPDHGWLRKYYAAGSDEARYDLSPAVERAVLWLRELQPRQFVGTESRLNTIVELLRQMVYGADDDPERRLVELRRRRAQLDGEIARAERGDVTVLDALSQRDRYQQFARTARELLSDFREVEDNFRRLDRDVRARIAGWDGAKGPLLDEVVGGRTSITESDQGRSFQAFYDFLLSHQRQTELADLLERMARIEHLDELDERMTRIHFDWIDAAERTQTTVRQLSDQLRRFLDDQAWIEQRRVFDLLRAIEAKALRLRDLADPRLTTEIDDTGVAINLPTERPLYRRPETTAIDSTGMAPGEEDFDSSALLSQSYVDRDELLRTVLTSLRRKGQVSLGEVVAGQPLQQGLAELVGYLSLSEVNLEVIFDEETRQRIAWTVDDDGADGDGADDQEDIVHERVAELPGVTFRRDAPAATVVTDVAGRDTGPTELSVAVANLCKGPVYRDSQPQAWEALERRHNQVVDYVAVLGLEVIVDEAEGYAYLRSLPRDDDSAPATQLPRLVARRTLSFHLSILLALLRKRLAEFDATSAETRLVLSRDQMVEMLRLFLPESSNDARLVDQIDAHLGKAVDLGFLRRLRAEPHLFEVRRILKAYVDGQWLADFDSQLQRYLDELGRTGDGA